METKNLVVMRSGNEELPTLFLIHDGTGGVVPYVSLVECLPGGGDGLWYSGGEY